MTILEINKDIRYIKRISKLGKEHQCRKTRTVYKIQCDVCDRIMHRSKGEAFQLEQRGRHACSPECIGKLGRKSNYQPRRARRKTGYIYIGSKREHRIIAAKTLGRSLKPSEIVHHIDGDKGGNTSDNLLVCINRKEHNRVHGQLEALAFLLVQNGDIKFCKICKLYYLQSDDCMCGESFSV